MYDCNSANIYIIICNNNTNHHPILKNKTRSNKTDTMNDLQHLSQFWTANYQNRPVYEKHIPNPWGLIRLTLKRNKTQKKTQPKFGSHWTNKCPESPSNADKMKPFGSPHKIPYFPFAIFVVFWVFLAKNRWHVHLSAARKHWGKLRKLRKAMGFYSAVLSQKWLPQQIDVSSSFLWKVH